MTNGFEFTVGLVNFCLLLFLLKIFLVDPLKVVAREREEKAQHDIGEAAQMLDEANAHRQRYQGLKAGLEQEKARIAEAARSDAEQVRRRIAEAAEAGARDILSRARGEVDSDRQAALAGLRLRAAEATVARARALLEAGLDGPAQRDILENFMAKVGAGDAR